MLCILFMALDLNEKHEYLIRNGQIEPFYKLYEGLIVREMLKLIADRRVPISTALLFERKVNSKKPDWPLSYFFTGDSIVMPSRGSAGRFKICLDSPNLRAITLENTLIDGGFVHDDYTAIKGVELFSGNLILNHDLTKRGAKAHEGLLVLCRNDQRLLNDAVDKIFAEGEKRYKYYKMMGFYLPDCRDNVIERAFCVNWLDGCGRSGASGDTYLDCDGGQLVGAAPEALSDYQKTLLDYRIDEEAVARAKAYLLRQESLKKGSGTGELPSLIVPASGSANYNPFGAANKQPVGSSSTAPKVQGNPVTLYDPYAIEVVDEDQRALALERLEAVIQRERDNQKLVDELLTLKKMI